jgi:ABC-type transporter Mla subunit MlaD
VIVVGVVGVVVAAVAVAVAVAMVEVVVPGRATPHYHIFMQSVGLLQPYA